MKTVKYLILMCLVLYSGSMTKAQTHWTYDDKNFEYDMSAFMTITENGHNISDLSDYEIAAFVDSECRGVSKVEWNDDGTSYLYIRIRSNISKGEKIWFKSFNKKTKAEQVFGNTITFKNRSTIGFPSTPSVLSTENNKVSVNAIVSGDGKVEGSGNYEIGTKVTLKAVANEGWHFVKWSDGVSETTRSFTVTGKTGLTAEFARNVYKVTFLASDGNTVLKTENVEFGTVIPLPTAPEKTGYTFKTWGDVPATMPAKDLTFTAQYTINKYLVKFISNNITLFEEKMPYGEPITIPEASEKEGHTFKTWGDVPATVPAHDVTFNAEYTVNKYHISFIVQNGTIHETDLEYGAKITVPTAPELEGHGFDTWGDVPETMPAKDLIFTAQYITLKYNVKFVANGVTVFEKQLPFSTKIEIPKAPAKEGHTFKTWGDVPETVPAHDVTFNAEYTVNKYHISFIVQNGTIHETDLDYGTKITVPTAPEKTGYTFKTWGDVPATMPAKNLTFTAQYTINKYLVKFISNNITLFEEKMPYGAQIIIPEASEKEGHTFKTWGDVPATVPAHDVTFNAEYTVNKYHIAFVADDKTVFEDSLEFGTTITIPTAPEKTGYTFKTWGDVPATMPAKDLTFTAQYTINKYLVKFISNNITLFEEKMPYGEQIIIPEAPAMEGHTFKTWGDVPATVPAKDMTFHAEYTVNKYHITFIAQNGTIHETDLEYGAKITVPTAPEVEGHDFDTWGDVPETMPAKDLTFTAQYITLKYNIKFVAEGVTVFEKQISFGSQIVVPEAPAKEGHKFDTWGDVPETMPAKDLTFTAQYTILNYNVKFVADGKTVSEKTLPYGAKIEIPAAPEKEGHTFKTWGDVPATVPAHDVTINAEYTVNKYHISFVAKGETVYEADLEYGTKIIVPDFPIVEGNTFNTWGEVPATMPAHDLAFTAQYTTLKFNVKFVADGKTVFEESLLFGTKIEIPEAPAKEGHTFRTWGDVPATVPARDVTFNAEYTVNKYHISFVAKGETVYETDLEFGATVNVPEAPEVEGHKFDTWGDIPATMPAKDLAFTAQYTILNYNVKFVADGKTVSEKTLPYGAKIEIPAAPTKEGYSFKSWGNVPETVPAQDVVFNAQYTIDNLVMKDFSAYIGTQTVLSVEMENNDEITGIQFDLMLPDGISVAADHSGYRIEIAGERSSEKAHTVASEKISDSVVRVTCHSDAGATFKGTSGKVLDITLDISKDMAEGKCTVVLKNVVLTDTEKNRIEVPQAKADITLSKYTAGDINDDSYIDVSDIAGVLPLMTDKPAEGLISEAADINDDGTIDVADIDSIAQMILMDKTVPAKMKALASNAFEKAGNDANMEILPFSLQANEEKEIEVLMNNPNDEFTGFQFDLYLPEGVSLMQDNSGYLIDMDGNRTSKNIHTLRSAQQKDGCIRVLLYATTAEKIKGTDNAVLRLHLKANGAVQNTISELQIKNAVMAHQGGLTNVKPVAYEASAVCGTPSGDIAMKGHFTQQAFDAVATALGNVTSVDLTAANTEPDGSFNTENPNVLLYLGEGQNIANSENVIYGNSCASLVLTDGYPFNAPKAFVADNATYSQNMAVEGWSTVCVPYAVEVPVNAVAEKSNGMNSDNTAAVFEKADILEANKPYIFKAAGNVEFKAQNVDVPATATVSEGALFGTYVTVSAENPEGMFVLRNDGKGFEPYDNKTAIPAFRAYLSTGISAESINIVHDDAVGIEEIKGEEALMDVYTTDGILVRKQAESLEGLSRGIYIVNGKKILVK